MDSIKLHKNTEKLKSIIYGSSDRSVNIGGDLIVKFHRANLSHRCFLCYLLCLDISENNLGVLIEVKFKEFIIANGYKNADSFSSNKVMAVLREMEANGLIESWRVYREDEKPVKILELKMRKSTPHIFNTANTSDTSELIDKIRNEQDYSYQVQVRRELEKNQYEKIENRKLKKLEKRRREIKFISENQSREIFPEIGYLSFLENKLKELFDKDLIDKTPDVLELMLRLQQDSGWKNISEKTQQIVSILQQNEKVINEDRELVKKIKEATFKINNPGLKENPELFEEFSRRADVPKPIIPKHPSKKKKKDI